MTIKPTVHFDRDVTLKSKIEVSATNGNSNIGGITEPIITQRSVDHTIRLKDGEANLLGGILQHQTTYRHQRHSGSGVSFPSSSTSSAPSRRKSPTTRWSS